MPYKRQWISHTFLNLQELHVYHHLLRDQSITKRTAFSFTLRSASGSLEQMQRLAVLVIDTGQTLSHGRVALLPGAGIGSESPVEVVLQIVGLHMDGCDVAGSGNPAHVLKVVLPVIMGQELQCSKHVLFHTFAAQVLECHGRVLDHIVQEARLDFSVITSHETHRHRMQYGRPAVQVLLAPVSIQCNLQCCVFRSIATQGFQS